MLYFLFKIFIVIKIEIMKYENEIFKILCTLSLITILSIFFINKCNAQTWTATDMNGTSYDLTKNTLILDN